MNSQTRILVIGGLVGAAVGAGIALAYARMEERNALIASRTGVRYQIEASDLMKLAVAAVPVVRMVVELLNPSPEEALPSGVRS